MGSSKRIRVWVTLGVGFAAGLMAQQFTGERVEAQPPPHAANPDNNLSARVAELEAKLASMSVVGDDVIFEGVNLIVQSGSGVTGGEVNGVGNLIVGYDEGDVDDIKSGSHNLIVGGFHTYTSYGGFVAGFDNAVTAPAASVSGGRENEAAGHNSSVSGGERNLAGGNLSSVTGGNGNFANGEGSTVSGGFQRGVIGLWNWRAGTLFEID